MKLCLIFALCLSSGCCDKLDRTYLPPEGALQSSGDPSDLKLPYDVHDNNIKRMGIEFQTSTVTNPTESDTLHEWQKPYNKNLNSDVLQNKGYFGDNNKKDLVNDNGLRNFKMYTPFEITKHALLNSHIGNDNNSDNHQLNPYLPLGMKTNQDSVTRFKLNENSDELGPFNANVNDSMGTAKLPYNVQTMMPSNHSVYPTANTEVKSEIEIPSSIYNKDVSQSNSVFGSEKLNRNEPNIQTTKILANNIASLEKSHKRPSLPLAKNDKNAYIISYENSITPNDGNFAFSFDTSNGIHVDEHGTSNNGVKAEGGYSYTGDDGKIYKIQYTADENGFKPTGDHLPTPPPIPEAILRVIELAMKNKENGIPEDNGMYDDNKYGYKNYDRGFEAKLKKPYSKLRSELGNYESKPENRPKGMKIIIDALSNKGFDLRNSKIGNIDTNIPYNSSENENQQPFSKQTLIDYQSEKRIVMHNQNNRRPLTESLRNNGNKQYVKPNEVEVESPIPTRDLKLNIKYKPNSTKIIQPQLNVLNGNNVNTEQSNFETQLDYTTSLTQKQFDTDLKTKENYANNRYNILPEIYKSFTIVNQNITTYEKNARKNLIKVKYDAEPMSGYYYPAPTKTYSVNFENPGNFKKDVEIKIPNNRGSNRFNMEELSNVALIRQGALNIPALKEQFIPKANNENVKIMDKKSGSIMGNLHSLPIVEAAPANLKAMPVANSKDTRSKPDNPENKLGGDTHFEQSPKAAKHPKNPQDRDFGGPKQKPYFDSNSGYHY